jgi:branched-chain amino acid transport system permease protein
LACKAFRAIREDEVAAQAMGINLFKHKVLSFAFGSFFAGVAGGLLASLLGTIDPNMFRITLTFNILLIVVLGGLGRITGTVISAVVVTVMMEALRFLDESINLGFIQLPGIPGMRMVVFSIILILVVLLRREGLMTRLKGREASYAEN